MKINGTASVPGARAEVYARLLDPAVLAECIPGCQQLVAAGDGVYEMKMKLALAALSGDFTGKIAISDAHPPERYRLRVDGSGKLGFIKGEGELRLSEAEAATAITYEGDVQAGGTLAAVGQRLLDTTAKMMIRRFFEKIGQKAG